MYKVKFTKSAAKELSKLSKDLQRKIFESLSLLEINPFAEIINFKKIKGKESLYRIRIGDYRVVYEINGSQLLIIVIRIGHRKDVYRYF